MEKADEKKFILGPGEIIPCGGPRTHIIYQMDMDCLYDLVNNPEQRELMEQKTARMVEKFGSVEIFQQKLIEQLEGMRFGLNEKVMKWFTLQQQLVFLERDHPAGEIVLPKASSEKGDAHG